MIPTEINTTDNTLLIEKEQPESLTTYKGAKYDIVSKVAYLIGVPRKIFENGHPSPSLEIFEELEKDKASRIVRNLCIIRWMICVNYHKICESMKYSHRNIANMPELVSSECFTALQSDGVHLVTKPAKPESYVLQINTILSDRINNCKSLFPDWINWEYLRKLFMMKKGMKLSGIKLAAGIYRANRMLYPYQVYINWTPRNGIGNILYNDSKFIQCLYDWNNNEFKDYNKVTDASDFTKGNIYDFIKDAGTIDIIVDCENADPFKFCAMMKSLEREYTNKIRSIILYDDIHTSSVWKMIDAFTSVPVERINVTRLKEDKSLVDIRMAMRMSREHYKNNVDSFIMVSSDSDFWGVIEELPEAWFLVAAERDKCGSTFKDALAEAEIFCCYMDDFYSGNIDTIKQDALLEEMNDYIHSMLHININDAFAYAVDKTRLNDLSAEEKIQLFKKCTKNQDVVIDESGNITITLKRNK